MWRKKEANIKDPELLTFYYMDNVLCNEYYLAYDGCMERYNSKRWGRSKLHKECMDHMDKYKACVVGINQEKIMLNRKKLSEDDLARKRYQNVKKKNEQSNDNNSGINTNDDGLIKM